MPGFGKYEFLGLKIRKNEMPLYKIRVSGNGPTETFYRSYKKVQNMLVQGIDIRHLALARNGMILNEETFRVEFKKLFDDLIRIALRDSSLSKFVVGDVHHVKFSLMQSSFRLDTNIIYKSLPVQLQFEMSPTEEITEPFDKPPIKLKVQYLLQGRIQKDLCTCLVFDRISQHIFGMSDYTNLQIRVLVASVSDVLSSLLQMRKTLFGLFSSILEKAVYEARVQLYAKEVAELLCARLIDKYNIISPNPYPLEQLSVNFSSYNKQCCLDSGFQDFTYHLSKCNFGDKLYCGIHIHLPIKLAKEKECSLWPRLIVTEKGILLQLIRTYEQVNIEDISSHLMRNLDKREFFLARQRIGLSSVNKLINEFIEYIDAIKIGQSM